MGSWYHLSGTEEVFFFLSVKENKVILVLAPDNNPVSLLEILKFSVTVSRHIGIDWSLIHHETIFSIESEVLKSTGSDYYLRQTLSWLEARNSNLHN